MKSRIFAYCISQTKRIGSGMIKGRYERETQLWRHTTAGSSAGGTYCRVDKGTTEVDQQTGNPPHTDPTYQPDFDFQWDGH
jgi:hypothetical protein